MCRQVTDPYESLRVIIIDMPYIEENGMPPRLANPDDQYKAIGNKLQIIADTLDEQQRRRRDLFDQQNIIFSELKTVLLCSAICIGIALTVDVLIE
ncbi:hypothetical protein EB796_002428 [Bugula neritina]|uniref:Uncharacterized protein n=1 Tax=Bugula neritina TaxID=10212 RepID=A0A7J7KM57_BUGNE|nr:hypothetical protein EB796_002428 [Bugula neritina]